MVANKFLEEIDLEDEIRLSTVIMCKHFHESVRIMSEAYFERLRRHNYVTPTSYLELILTFKKLLGIRRNDILLMKNRYLTGMLKLWLSKYQCYVYTFYHHYEYARTKYNSK